MDTNGKAIEIITGRNGKGTSVENNIVSSIFGELNTKEKFKLYFYWYNVIHELGHGIMAFNCESRPHPVIEEQFVNEIAVAFWLYYGEEEKINDLYSIVSYALSKFICPAKEGVSHIEWAHENWGTDEVMNFNNYGWFQMNCVNDALLKRKCLELTLIQAGVNNINVQPQKTLIFSKLEETTVSDIISQAAFLLREWGVVLPDVHNSFDNDPNRHMSKIIDVYSGGYL